MLGNRVSNEMCICPECGVVTESYYLMGDFACRKCDNVVRSLKRNKENIKPMKLAQYLIDRLKLKTDSNFKSKLSYHIKNFLDDICETDKRLIEKYKEENNETNN